MGLEPTALGLGIRLPRLLSIPPSVAECCPVRILASGLYPPVSLNCPWFRWAHLQDISNRPLRPIPISPADPARLAVSFDKGVS